MSECTYLDIGGNQIALREHVEAGHSMGNAIKQPLVQPLKYSGSIPRSRGIQMLTQLMANCT